MIKKLLNPFIHIAGIKSLIFGILILLLTSIIGYFSNTHFPDIISIKIINAHPLWYFIIQNLLNWFVVSILFYIAAIIFSKSSVRMVDIFGTQALARTPYLFASFLGFSKSINNFGKYLLWTHLHQGEPIEISSIEIIIAILFMILTLLLTIWLIILMVNAFKVSANLKGTKLSLIFIVVLIISMLLSVYINKILIQGFST